MSENKDEKTVNQENENAKNENAETVNKDNADTSTDGDEGKAEIGGELPETDDPNGPL